MLYFLARGTERRMYELRLNPQGEGVEIHVREEDGREYVERFPSLERAQAREHELLSRWRESGWVCDR